jgi:sortase A
VQEKPPRRDLTSEELRRLAIDKRRQERQERLQNYRRTGRVVSVIADEQPRSLDQWQVQVEESVSVAPNQPRLRRLLDVLLLILEIGAFVGFVWVIYTGYGLLQALDRETRAITTLPVPYASPTASLEPQFRPPAVAPSRWVLPSGHYPPNAPGGARFNQDEIPSGAQDLVDPLGESLLPTPGPELANRIEIPALGVDAPIVQGDGWEELKHGVGQHPGSGIPGQPGNVVLSAHNDVFGKIFRHLDRLEPGDEIIIYTNLRRYIYTVIGRKIVKPTRIAVMDSTIESTTTLISCYPYMLDNKRIVVTARLMNE